MPDQELDSHEMSMVAHIAVPSTAQLHTTHIGSCMTSLPSTINLYFPPSSMLQLTRQLLPGGSSATRPCLFPTPGVPAHLSIKSHLLHLQKTTHRIMPHLLYNYHLIRSLIIIVICSALSMLWNLKCMVGKGNLFYAQKIHWLLRKKNTWAPLWWCEM